MCFLEGTVWPTSASDDIGQCLAQSLAELPMEDHGVKCGCGERRGQLESVMPKGLTSRVDDYCFAGRGAGGIQFYKS